MMCPLGLSPISHLKKDKANRRHRQWKVLGISKFSVLLLTDMMIPKTYIFGDGLDPMSLACIYQ